MWIHAVGVVGGAVVHREPAPARTRRLPILAEHEVVDEQPPTALEQLGQGLRPLLGRERVLHLHRHPGQLPPLLLDPLGALVELALGGEQPLASRLPLLLCPDLHRSSFVVTSPGWTAVTSKTHRAMLAASTWPRAAIALLAVGD